MAYIAYGNAAAAFPTVYSDAKYPKDIVINGMLFDIDTFTPKIGSHVMMWTGDISVASKVYTSLDDDDAYYFGLWNNDSTEGQYTTTMSPNYPYVQRDIKTDGTHWNVTTLTQVYYYIQGQTAIWGRDFLDHPLKCSHYNETTSEYIDMYPNLNYSGRHACYAGGDGWTRYQDRTYDGSTASSFLWDADTDSGMLFTMNASSASINIQQLAVRNYSSNSLLHTTTTTSLYAPSTTDPVFIHHLTKSNNGDHFFLGHMGGLGVGSGDNVDLLRYDNSSNGITVEYNDFAEPGAGTGMPMSIPSNVVYHQKTADASTSKKICYYFEIDSASFGAAGNLPWFIEIDVVNNTITNTQCTGSFPTLDGADDDLWTGSFTEGEGPYVLLENRILSASQDIDSQKYLFNFIQSNGISHATPYDHCYMMTKISAANPTVLSAIASSTTFGVWEDLLTASSKNTATNDIVPWCVAPLNVEHTLMMVYTKYSTHLIKFDTSAETLTEIWMDDDTYFNEVMWLPSGKILTGNYENKFGNDAIYVIHDAPRPIQVWAEDLIYNVDITTSSNYVTYAGSDVTNTLSISAYDGNDARVATDLTLQIVGPALFDNSTKTKSVTTSTSAGVSETITINDDGHVEVKVIEIQS